MTDSELVYGRFTMCTMFFLFEGIMNPLVYICKKILQHVREYCQEAAIHGPQHIVNQRLAIFERLVL